jgi:hypothetical protein
MRRASIMLRRTSIIFIFFATICGICVLAQPPATAGPERGTLVLDGGRAEGFIRRAAGFFPANAGALPDSATCFPHRPLDPELSRLCRIATNRSDAIDKFVQLAGGSGARIVVIPTAWNEKFNDGSAAVTPDHLEQLRIGVQKTMGVHHVTILHTRDRRQADQGEFVAPLQQATGVWIDGATTRTSGTPTWAPGWRLKSRRYWPAAGSSPAVQPAPRSRARVD